MPVEHEKAMGFPEGYTQVVGISHTQRLYMLGRVMDPHTLQFMMQVCKYMAPIADNFCMPNTNVPTCQNLGGTRDAIKAGLLSEANVLSPPLFKRARTRAAGSKEAELLLCDIQREQHIQHSARSVKVVDQPPA